jgi:hypothetical protein
MNFNRSTTRPTAHAIENIISRGETADLARLYHYRQPKITRAQFAYLAIYLVLIGNVAAEEARTERLFRGPDERLYNLQFGKIPLPDSEPAVVIYIEPLRPTTTAR